jgi:6-phosphogluconolactonase
MTTKAIPGMLLTLPGPADVANEAAARIAASLRKAIGDRGAATLALSGGETPRATYACLALAPDVDWSRVRIYWVDERAVPPDDPQSNYKSAKDTLLDAARVPPDNVRRMPAERADLDEAARAYEQLLRAEVPCDDDDIPSFDVMVLGVGDDGHTASLLPDHPAVATTDRLVAAIGVTPGREPRMTLTVPVIERARSVFILAVGAKKTPAIERVWSASGSLSETPARVVRGVRGEVWWILDKAAAGLG